LRVVIVGGGITGMFVAYYLLKDAHDVTIVDENSLSAPTTVFSAGLITPSASVIPSMWLPSILAPYFGRPDPIYLSMWEVFRHPRWFWDGMRRGLSGHGDILSKIGNRSLQLYANFFEETHVQVDLINGLVDLYVDPATAKREAGLSGAEFLDEDEVAKMGFKEFGGGVRHPQELSVNPLKLADALRMILLDSGVRLMRGRRASLKLVNAGVSCVEMEDGAEVSGEVYVVAGGAWSGDICKILGYKPPILPARGLTMLFDTGGEQVVSSPALLEDYGIAVVQHDQHVLRLTAFFDMVGFQGVVGDRRKNWLLERAKQHIIRFDRVTQTMEGVGFRPCTPDQIPIIGPVPHHNNVYLASGNCRLGITLAPATAEIIRTMISARKDRSGKGENNQSWSIFRAERFTSH